MKFEILDKRMRVFETNMDQCVLPELYIVARLDGKSFTKLTKELLDFERPFDIRFRDAMVQTTKHLMNCGFNIVYGYTESDEISLLFQLDENSFGRKIRKLTSVLAGEASACFSLALNTMAVFDCRIIPLPNEKLVIDYFRWRAEDANRNALNAYCYWKLRDQGLPSSMVTNKLSGLSVGDKNEILYQQGINYNDLPAWQKRGIGFYYATTKKRSFDPVKQQEVTIERRLLICDTELPVNLKYSSFLEETLFKNVNTKNEN
jgi:tRNA(His) guanylyltransferase